MSGVMAPGETLPALLLHRAQTTPDGVAMRAKRLGVWKPFSWRAYGERAAAVGLGLEAEHQPVREHRRRDRTHVVVGGKGGAA